MSPRIIRLRRPVTLSIQEGVFVPEGIGVLDEVDRRWDDLCRANPAYFDGRLLHVLGVHRNGHGGAVLHVMDCAYRFFAVQDEQFDLGVRGLGVKGITTHGAHLLMGLRSPAVAFYRNMWEFAPGGSVCPGDNPASVVQHELREETGLDCAVEPIATSVIFDAVLRCWEIVYRMEADSTSVTPNPAEYSQVEWRTEDNLPRDLSPIAQQMVSLL